MELLTHEKEALGLYLSGHPIDRHAENLRAFGAKTVGDLTMTEIPQSTDGAPGRLIIEDVYVGGIVVGFRGLKTKKGDPMCVFTLEDHQGAVEVVVFPEMFGAPSRVDRERRAAARARQVRARRRELALPVRRHPAAGGAARAPVARRADPVEGHLPA